MHQTRFILDENIMREHWSIKQPHIKAKILGISFIIIGLLFAYNQTALYLKIGIGCILLGLFTIVMITEKTIPENIGNAQIKGPLTAVKQLITQLNLKGNAIFLPTNKILSEERVFIPLKETNQPKIPEVDEELVFITGSNNTSIGISLPPSGLPLLSELEKETEFNQTDLAQIEEQLQQFIAKDIIESVNIKEKNNLIHVQLKKPVSCPQDTLFCTQYPCPACSSILTAIAKATQKRLHIKKINQNKKTITFILSILE